ncbi:MAG: helix-turn-helix domain-containing protein [Wujia sp.]
MKARNLTQSELATKLNVSDKTVSKWETAKGYPNISLLEPIANVIHSTGEFAASCHGVQLVPELAECSDENHKILVDRIEDEYYVQINHDMTKEHYISFIAALASDGSAIIGRKLRLYLQIGIVSRDSSARTEMFGRFLLVRLHLG